MAAAGAAVGAFAVTAVNDFASFQNKMNEVFTLLPGITKEQMGKMTEDVKAFSNETGKLPEEVIPALYQAISAGVPPDNVFDFLRTANEAAVGGVSSLETAVDGLSSVVNAYGVDVLSTKEASDAMFTAVRLGKTDFQQLSASLFNVVPTAAALGVSFDDVAAALAAMTAQGIPTSVATTQLRQAFVELSKEGTKTSTTFQAIAGQTFREFIASGHNVQDALALMEQAAKASGVGINDLFGSVEAGSAALALTGKGAQTFSDDLEAMGNKADATKGAFDTMADGIQQQTSKIVAKVKTLLIDVGGALSETGIGPIIGAFGPTFGRLFAGAIGSASALVLKASTGLVKGALDAVAGSAFIKAAGTAIGGVVGAAQAEAQALVATGVGAVQNLGARIAAMAIPLAPAGTTVGTAVGAAMGAGMIVGAAGVLAGTQVIPKMLAEAFVAAHFRDDLADQARDAALTYAHAYDDKVRTDFAEIVRKATRDALEAGMSEGDALKAGEAAGLEFLGGFTTVSQQRGAAVMAQIGAFIRSEREDARQAGVELGTAATDGVTSVTRTYGPDLTTIIDGFRNAGREAVKALGDEITTQAQEQHKLWAFFGADGPAAYSQGVKSAYSTVVDAFNGLKQLMKDTLSPAKKIAELEGIATAKLLAKGLKSAKPEVHAASEQIALDALAQLQQLKPGSAAIGELTTKLLANALPNELPYLRDQIKLITGAVTTPLATLPPIADRTGDQIVARFVKSINDGKPLVISAIDNFTRIVTNRVQLGSPAKEGEWSKNGGPIEWLASAMRRMVRAAIATTHGLLPAVSAAMDELARAASPILSPSFAPALAMPDTYGLGVAALAPAGLHAQGMPFGGTVRHDHSGTIRHDITESGARALKAAGYDARDVAELMQAVGEAYGFEQRRFSEAPRY